VATWWTGPSQRRLFSSVSTDKDNHQRWVNGTKYSMQDLAQDSGEYLSALRNVYSLTLCNTQVEHVGEDQFRTRFSAFREALMHLSLEITTSIGAFVALVDYFPNIINLQLPKLELEPDEGPVPPLFRPFRGSVCIRDVQLEFLDRFAKLNLEYEELAIGPSTYENRRYLESALQISMNTVRFLRLGTEIRCEQPSLTPIKTTSLPRPLTFKTELQRWSTTFDSSKSWDCW